jgi:uncharacterized membrane protein
MLMQLIAFAVSVIPFNLGLLILLPIGLTSMYVSYRDIFSETEKADKPEAGNPAVESSNVEAPEAESKE